MPFLLLLLAIEASEIFTLTIYVPDKTLGVRFIDGTDNRLKRTGQTLNLHYYIKGEANVKAGNMAILGK